MQVQHTLRREGFITNLVISSPLKEIRISATVMMSGQSRTFVEAQVVSRDGEYIPVLSIEGGQYKGKGAFNQASAIHHTYRQMEWFASDLNAFERDASIYVDRIQDYLEERSEEGLSLYLPLYPISLTDKRASQVLAMIARSGQYGDLATTADASKLDMNLFKAITILAESIEGVYVADEAPFTAMAQIMENILEADHA